MLLALYFETVFPTFFLVLKMCFLKNNEQMAIYKWQGFIILLVSAQQKFDHFMLLQLFKNYTHP